MHWLLSEYKGGINMALEFTTVVHCKCSECGHEEEQEGDGSYEPDY